MLKIHNTDSIGERVELFSAACSSTSVQFQDISREFFFLPPKKKVVCCVFSSQLASITLSFHRALASQQPFSVFLRQRSTVISHEFFFHSFPFTIFQFFLFRSSFFSLFKPDPLQHQRNNHPFTTSFSVCKEDIYLR